jgi:hypothetical protein
MDMIPLLLERCGLIRGFFDNFSPTLQKRGLLYCGRQLRIRLITEEFRIVVRITFLSAEQQPGEERNEAFHIVLSAVEKNGSVPYVINCLIKTLESHTDDNRYAIKRPSPDRRTVRIPPLINPPIIIDIHSL